MHGTILRGEIPYASTGFHDNGIVYYRIAREAFLFLDPCLKAGAAFVSLETFKGAKVPNATTGVRISITYACIFVS